MPAPADLPEETARLRRPARIAGVCAGLSLHLGIPVRYIRAAMVVLALGGGAGALLYALLWATLPGESSPTGSGSASPISRARLAARATDDRGTGGAGSEAAEGGSVSGLSQTVIDGGSLILAALFLASWRFGLLDRVGAVGIVIVIIAGAALAWSQMDNLVGPDRNLGAVLRVAGGVCLAVVGILVWVAADSSPYKLISGLVTGGALVAGIGVVLAPLWLRTNRALADTRAAEIREAERADIAAHLHDSVLQTLTLIRKRAEEPETVARLARSQERELRAWLYTDRPAPGTSVADAFTDLAGEIEDRHGVAVDVVCVGDRAPDRDTEVIVAATREALSNAVRHGAPPVSLYVEAGDQRLEVFVRDRGPGFDLDAIAEDRHGVRQSIIARMERHGGSARVRRLETGTEVVLSLPT
ncbi:ATPase/histidine kinase/DNA gyrase B/HSP90 domain protein [Actinomyces johnsonii F0542]|uniref:ATPase/histidine kinase/DNA gyrase B/HSP90 domain protein n=1 Tax=Actinomyces johnsonii F0542 TaxID=1321818 RepID=U1QHX3_9ACTO|nr:ATPase/histidine kinase/DNA gyrase B/HSP90 domain protein [Actinomyces johnsonii F0542]